jgi:hypothetical protein
MKWLGNRNTSFAHGIQVTLNGFSNQPLNLLPIDSNRNAAGQIRD